MIATKDFVMINFPKTGSSFARKFIHDAYTTQKESRSRLFPWGKKLSKKEFEYISISKVGEGTYNGLVDQHGKRCQIPQKHIKKKIVSITRNPFSRYRSIYQYGWWKQNPPAPLHTIKKAFPNFPNLNFEEFFAMLDKYGTPNILEGANPSIEIGYHSAQFIRYFHKRPQQLLTSINAQFIESSACTECFQDVSFLRQETLRRDLTHLFQTLGFNSKQIEAIAAAPSLNKSEDDRDFCITTHTAQKILEKDRLIFKIFPDYKAI